MDFISFDSGYLQRLAAGDADAEEHCNRYFGELIFIKLRARQLPRHSIEDIRQETFLRVFQVLRKDGIRQPERIGAFVNAVCNNVMLEFQRAGARTAVLEETPDPPDQSGDFEQRLIEDERRAHLRRLLARMPAKNQRLLRAVFLEECPLDDVCREFGVDRNYLRVLLFRARTQLRDELRRSEKKTAAGVGG